MPSEKVCNKSDEETYLDDGDFPAGTNLTLNNDDTIVEGEAQPAVRGSTELQTTSSPVTLRRSQRQIKKPARYCDSHMLNLRYIYTHTLTY